MVWCDEISENNAGCDINLKQNSMYTFFFLYILKKIYNVDNNLYNLFQ